MKVYKATKHGDKKRLSAGASVSLVPGITQLVMNKFWYGGVIEWASRSIRSQNFKSESGFVRLKDFQE